MPKWKKGESGGGVKPKGAIHQRTVFLAALKAESSSEQEFAQKLIKSASDGNPTAIQIIAQRLWKPSKPQLDPVKVAQGDTKDETAQHVLDAVAAGQITPDQGDAVLRVLRGASELCDIQELMARVEKLEGET